MLNFIRVFIKVTEAGSFSKAGEVLNMAPSSVARNIDNLEQELNVTLFKRSTRKLVLTEEGQQFLGGAEKLLFDADELKASMNQVNQAPEGVLRISAFESFGRLVVSPLLPEFLARYPGIKVEINLDNQLVDLSRDNVDLGIRVGQPVDSSLRARKLLKNKTWICASPEYFERHPRPETPEDLKDHNCFILCQDRQRYYWHFKRNKETAKIQVQGNLSSKGGTPLLEAAIHGGGIVQMSQWMLLDYVIDGKLEICLPDWQSSLQEGSNGEVYAVYLGNKYMRPAVRVFIDYLVEKLQQRLRELDETYGHRFPK